jgi:hypothetical protein
VSSSRVTISLRCRGQLRVGISCSASSASPQLHRHHHSDGVPLRISRLSSSDSSKKVTLSVPGASHISVPPLLIPCDDSTVALSRKYTSSSLASLRTACPHPRAQAQGHRTVHQSAATILSRSGPLARCGAYCGRRFMADRYGEREY